MIERTPEQFAALIRLGHSTPGVKENHKTFISKDPFGGYQACAVGMAYIAAVGDPERAYLTYNHRVRFEFVYSPIAFFATELGLNQRLVAEVSNSHCAGKKALKIAAEIHPLKVVENKPEWKVQRPSLYQRAKAWLFRAEPRPQLRLVTS